MKFLSLLLGFLFLSGGLIATQSNVSDSNEENNPTETWDEISQRQIDHTYAPLALNLSGDGSKFVRFLLWHQQWMVTNNLAGDSRLQLSSMIRRSRFMAMAQVSPRFLILTHFGLNNLSTGNLTSMGNNGDGPQLFLHDAWTEFKITTGNQLFLGGGLHYWRGLTRLSSQSTLNFMPIDNSRPYVHWHSLGITDQFVRHIGFYAKGEIGKFDYRLALNNPLNPANALGAGNDFGGLSNLSYTGSSVADENGNPVGNTIVEGYFRYNFLESESTKLPYQVGTYFGQKRILGVGAGFFAHPNAMYDNLNLEHRDVLHLGADVFLDHPVGNGNGINAYLSWIRFDYGDLYMSRWAGTGTNWYTHFGYYLGKLQLMPYIAWQNGNYQAFNNNLTAMNLGVNYLVNGHNAKITLDYHSIFNNPLEGGTDPNGVANQVRQVRLQLHVFL